MRKGLTGIVSRQGIGNTPARVHMRTGVMEVDPDVWFRLPAVYRQFIILHEAGHRKLGTSDEFAADRYAFTAMMAMGRRPDVCVDALNNVLSFRMPEHYARVAAMRELAASAGQTSFFSGIMNPTYYQTPPVLKCFGGGDGYENFIPVGALLNAGKKGVQALANQRQNKIDAGMQVKGGILGKILDKVSPGQDAPASQQTAPKNTLISNLGTAAAQLKLKGAKDAGASAMLDNPAAGAPGSDKAAGNSQKKTMMYIGIGVGVLVVIGVIAYLATR